MTLRAFIEDILDRILNAIRALHIEITNTTITGSIVSFVSKYAGLPLKSCVVDFEDETGIDSLDFSVTGKNLCPPVIMNLNYQPTTGEEGTSSVTASSIKFPINIDKTYVFTKNCNINSMFLAWDAQDNFVARSTGNNANSRVITKSFFSTIGAGTGDLDSITKIAIRFYEASNSSQDINDVVGAEYQIESGDTATTYEPFGDTKLFSFGKTIQNGSLKVLTGELTNNDITPPEIINLGGMEISTLQGENNLFASTGETTIVTIEPKIKGGNN